MSFQLRIPLVRPLMIPVERFGWRGSRIRMRSSGVAVVGAVADIGTFSVSVAPGGATTLEESPPGPGGRAQGAGVWERKVQGPRFAERTVEAERERAQLLHHSHSAISMSLERT